MQNVNWRVTKNTKYNLSIGTIKTKIGTNNWDVENTFSHESKASLNSEKTLDYHVVHSMCTDYYSY